MTTIPCIPGLYLSFFELPALLFRPVVGVAAPFLAILFAVLQYAGRAPTPATKFHAGFLGSYVGDLVRVLKVASRPIPRQHDGGVRVFRRHWVSEGRLGQKYSSDNRREMHCVLFAGTRCGVET